MVFAAGPQRGAQHPLDQPPESGPRACPSLAVRAAATEWVAGDLGDPCDQADRTISSAHGEGRNGTMRHVGAPAIRRNQETRRIVRGRVANSAVATRETSSNAFWFRRKAAEAFPHEKRLPAGSLLIAAPPSTHFDLSCPFAICARRRAIHQPSSVE